MSVPQALPTRKSADEILSAVKVSDVCYELTRTKPRRTGTHTCRAVAAWRGGDGWSVSLDDERGLWHDFVTDEGGGILDLVVRIRGGTRQDALHWVAEFAGMPLEDRPLTPVERAEWGRQQREIERVLPTARYWRRAAVNLVEEWLVDAKAKLFDALPEPEDLSQSIQPRGARIYEAEQMLTRLRAMNGADLVDMNQSWCESDPGITAYMVQWAKQREALEQRAVLRYLRDAEAAR